MLRRDTTRATVPLRGDPAAGLARKPSTLVLFDIDGTLLVGGAFSEAFSRASEDVLGFAPEGRDANVNGGIPIVVEARQMAEKAGTPKDRVEEVAGRIIDRAIERFAEYIKHTTISKCDGVDGLLAALSADAGIAVGIVTNNLERVGWLKLENAGIADFFRAGGLLVGSDNGMEKDRNIAIAILMAEKAAGVSFERKSIVYIGDQVADIRAAATCGIRSIGVSTGKSTHEELEAAGAAAVLRSLSSVAEVISAIYAAERQRSKSKNV